MERGVGAVERDAQLFDRDAPLGRQRFGGDGDFLFGEFGAVDIMFAPVCTRIITYSLPVARFAGPYIEAVLTHPFMQDWIAAAQAEEWVIEKFEQPAGV